MKRKALNGTYSSSEDEDLDVEANGRSIRQGHRGRTRRVGHGRGSTSSSIVDGEDPCGVRRKRTFFRTKGEDAKAHRDLGLSVPLANGLTDISPEIVLNGTNGLGMNGYLEGRMTEAASRANSPGSVV